ncbi:tyrosine-protein kinase family protein [Pedobacter sp. SYP-B3415]|uniref:GumC family protein n=1 Tax=Pedobacter sp. SYP-B3415 TaxID=2496641 RepID=UPI00101D7E5D|nr:tyrosine-protein kinase family protein [Pedobacter sp. SYP-B3415]
MAFQQQHRAHKQDLRTQVFKYLTHWRLFLICMVLGLAGSYIYMQVTVPQYKIKSTLLVLEDTKGDGMLKGTAFSDLNMFKSTSTVDNEMEVIRSRDLLYKVLDSLSLQTTYFTKPLFIKKEVYGARVPLRVETGKLTEEAYKTELKVEVIDSTRFRLRDKDYAGVYRFGELVNRPAYEFRVFKTAAFRTNSPDLYIHFSDLEALAEAYSMSKLVVLPVVKDANTIVLSLVDALPQRGLDILNTLIGMYNRENVQKRNLIALNTIRFIDKKLAFLSGDLSGVEADVESYKRSNRITELSADAQQSLASSGDYSQQLAATEVQLELVQSLLSYLASSGNSYTTVPTTLGLKDPILLSLMEKYNSLQVEKERLLRTNRVDNPLVVNITEQLAGLKRNLAENLQVIRKGLVLERNGFQRKSRQFEAQLNNVPVVERGLLERSRVQGVKTSIYHYLLQKREETELSLSATIPTSQLIDRPAYSAIPVKPRGQLVYLLGLMIGVAAPFSFIQLRSRFNTKVSGFTDVEAVSGNVRILGELTHKAIAGPIVVHRDKTTTISELFRYIRNNLQFLNGNNLNQVLLVTSCSKGEGKTFFSVNLGITLSLVDKKVVLLEFDLRKPDLLKDIKMANEYGLSDYLSGARLAVKDIVKPVSGSPNLWAIGCGKIPRNPSELLLSGRLDELFDELRQEFDYIIVDTSPVGLVSDAFSLAGYADASIYVVRYNYTNLSDLAVLEDIYANDRLKNPMVVFNDAKKENRVSRYGHYGYN